MNNYNKYKTLLDQEFEERPRKLKTKGRGEDSRPLHKRYLMWPG